MNFLKSLLVLGLLAQSISVSAQVFVDTNKVWSLYTCNDTSACDRKAIQLKGDTLFGSAHYTRFIAVQDSGSIGAWIPIGAREDLSSKKIYFYNNSSEYLAYDFSLNVNDTFKTDIGGCHVEMVVNNVDSFTLETGEKRKRIFFSSDTWIEGIGSLYGPIYPSLFSCTFDLFPELICELENDTVKYHNTAYENCFLFIGINEPEIKSGFHIYPNPLSDKSQLMIIYPLQSVKLKIIVNDITGRQVFEQELPINTNKYNIDLPVTTKGIYIVRLLGNEKESRIKLMIE